MTVAQEQQQDLPWWTEEEMQKVAAIDDFVRATSNYYDVPGTIDESPIKYNSYKADVLDKYRSNPYSDMGYDEDSQSYYLRFLSTDNTKPAESMIRFCYANNDVVTVRVADTINIPPRQMWYWLEHQIQK